METFSLYIMPFPLSCGKRILYDLGDILLKQQIVHNLPTL